MARSRKQRHGPSVYTHAPVRSNDARETRQYAGSLKHHAMLLERDSERIQARKARKRKKS